MNIQLADRLLAKTQEVETILLEIETEIGKLAPDLYSNLESKKNVLVTLRYLQTLKEDLTLFREGKALVNVPKLLSENMMKKKDVYKGFLGDFQDLFNKDPKEDK